MTLSYSFTLSCPVCSSELHHRSFVRLSETRTQAETFCPECLTYWRVDVGLTPVDVIAVATGEDAARLRAAEAVGNEAMSPMAG